MKTILPSKAFLVLLILLIFCSCVFVDCFNSVSRAVIRNQIVSPESLFTYLYADNKSSSELNILATNYIVRIGKTRDWKQCSRIPSILKNVTKDGPDSKTYTALMSLFIRRHCYEEALSIFDLLREDQLHDDDVVVYINAARAIGQSRPWMESVRLLEEALVKLGPIDVVAVAVAVLTTLRYTHYNDIGMSPSMSLVTDPRKSLYTVVGQESHSHHPSYKHHSLSKCSDVLTWMNNRGVYPTSQALDSVVAIACNFGDASDVEKAVSDMVNVYNTPLDVTTFNTILNYYVERGDKTRAMSTLQLMRKSGLTPDMITFGTMLKLGLRMDDREFLSRTLVSFEAMMMGSGVDIGMQQGTMKNGRLGPALNDKTRSLLVKAYCAVDRRVAAEALVQHERDGAVSAAVITNAISVSRSSADVISQYRRALSLGLIDAPLCAVTLKILIDLGDIPSALSFFDKEILNGGFFVSGDDREGFNDGTVSVKLKEEFRLEIDLFSFSSIITSLLMLLRSKSDQQGQAETSYAFGNVVGKAERLFTFLHRISREHRALLTDALCQRLMKDLVSIEVSQGGVQFNQTLSRGEGEGVSDPHALNIFSSLSELACDLHLDFLSHTSCKAEVLSALMRQLQYVCEGPLSIGCIGTSQGGGIIADRADHEFKGCRRRVASKANALLMLYAGASTECSVLGNDTLEGGHGISMIRDKEEKTVNRAPSRDKKRLLRVEQYNCVLAMLSSNGMVDDVEKLFSVMSNNAFTTIGRSIILDREISDASLQTLADIFDTDTNDLSVDAAEKNDDRRQSVWALRPSTFTIAELLRFSRECRPEKHVSLAFCATLWAVEMGTFLPTGVVSDAVSLLYGEGRRDLARACYRELYEAGSVQHWSPQSAKILHGRIFFGRKKRMSPRFSPDDEGKIEDEGGLTDKFRLELDLHFYSRGMAYAAITCAIEEVRYLARHLNRDDAPSQVDDGGDSKTDSTTTTLTIITGKNVMLHKNTKNGGNVDSAYRLTTEIQNVLIDDFFPPIPSSTVPGNPGRLYVEIPIGNS